MSKAIIEIPGPNTYFERALAAAARADAGEAPRETDYHLGFADASQLFSALTPARLALVQALKSLGPTSSRALATHLGRNDSSVQSDVAALLDLRILERGDQNLISVPWDGLEIHLTLHQTDAAA